MKIKIAGNFTASLWKEVKPIYKSMVNHPFSRGLQNGTLNKKAFKHYLSQDILYLKDDGKMMENLAKKAKENRKFFKQMSGEIVALEKVFEKRLLKKFGVKKAKKKSKVIKKYTSYLLFNSLHEPFYVGIAAALPCFWLYSAVGLKIHKKSKTKNPYSPWIGFYKDKEVIKSVNDFINIVENVSLNLTKKEKSKMKKAFIKSSKYELEFFTEAIKQ